MDSGSTFVKYKYPQKLNVMNKLKTLSAILLLTLTFTFSSCSSDNDYDDISNAIDLNEDYSTSNGQGGDNGDDPNNGG